MRMWLACMGLLLVSLGSTPASAQIQPLAEPTFKFLTEEIEFSAGHDELVPGETETMTIPIFRMCGDEIAMLDDQAVLVTPEGPAFRLETPVLMEFPQTFCYAPHGAIPLTIEITATGALSGSRSFTLRLEPQEPDNGLHGAGQPITLLVGVVVANTTAPAVEPVMEAQESPGAAAVLSAVALLAVALRRRRA